jgi:hypothetical protein
LTHAEVGLEEWCVSSFPIPAHVVQRGSSLLLRTYNFRAEPTCSILLRYTHNEVALCG